MMVNIDHTHHIDLMTFNIAFPKYRKIPNFKIDDYIMPKHALKNKDELFLADGSPNYVVFQVMEEPVYCAGEKGFPFKYGRLMGWYYRCKVVIAPEEYIDNPYFQEHMDRPEISYTIAPKHLLEPLEGEF
ncbi:hypothetical protein E2329_22530 [Salmonella enterica subsp. enterica]|nr:hypothetical protein [Salmonella enterica subsp. enterica serovar Paratyphi A]